MDNQDKGYNAIKNIYIIFMTVMVIFALCLMFVTGHMTNKNVYLKSSQINVEKNEIVINIGISSSMGYVRDYVDNYENGKHFLTFYSTYGGLNSSFGSKNQFVIPVNPEDTAIYFITNNGARLVLSKDIQTGQWIKN